MHIAFNHHIKNDCTHEQQIFLLSSENRKNHINDAVSVDKRSAGYKRRQLSMQKAPTAMQERLKAAKNADIPEKICAFRQLVFIPQYPSCRKGTGL